MAARIAARVLALLAPVVFLAAALTGSASAHDVRPAYLQIDSIGPERYAVFWRTPLLSGAQLPVALALPDNATMLTQPSVQTLPGSRIERSAFEIPGGLAGKRIRFPGLEATITDVLVRIDDGRGASATSLVRPSRPWLEVHADQGTLGVALTYLVQGIEHILYGLDHLLFVASLMLIVRDWRVLVQTITAFTIAHSVTLALATFGLVTLPPAPVEAMIALSILLVAAEAVRMERGEKSLTITWPWIVAFGFGLLHGFGFAGAMVGLGLPQGDVPLALFAFNVGVEIGQLVFIAALLLVGYSARLIFALGKSVRTAAAYGIGCVAAFWVVERLDAIFS
ncbi:HupE/UreJ family protein [Microbaculum marinum]|uniref:HupE/UreJ family protein n=1 Tax=Microbaculum marinum TaxID=1764581 RepID=A0AAW9RXY4_9HYPH